MVPIQDSLTITNPAVVPVLFHEEKQRILQTLIPDDRTIQDLSTLLNINPGTIKRHLTDLVDSGLAAPSREEKNEYGIKLKYYRATARRFIVALKWPAGEE